MTEPVFFTSRPVANVNSLWSANLFSLINNEITEPSSAGDATIAVANRLDDNKKQTWQMTALPEAGTAEAVKLWLRHQWLGNELPIAKNVSVQIGFGETFEVAKTFATVESVGFAWTFAIWEGSWDNALFDDFRIGIDPGALSNSDEYHLACAYAETSYTPSGDPGGGGGGTAFPPIQRTSFNRSIGGPASEYGSDAIRRTSIIRSTA